MAVPTEISSNKMFGGLQKVFSHASSETQCEMRFGVFLPPKVLAEPGAKCPVLYYLSGLTCTEQNFVTKAGAQRQAAARGLILVAPDTSPRGCNIPGEDDAYDFGSGAGFYLDATEEKWKAHYRMFSYVTKELTALVDAHFPSNGRRGIMGHSMGGHGALTIFLKSAPLFSTLSAFAPICNPTQCPWGEKAFSGYLGADSRATWEEYDACCLLQKFSGPAPCGGILVDQGAADDFLGKGQLLPERLQAAAEKAGVPIKLRMQDGYDHSYYFMASFMEEHVNHHADGLC